MSSFKFKSMRFKLKLVIRLENKVINVKITFCFFSVFFSFWQSQRPPSWICRDEMFLKPAQSHAKSFVFSKKKFKYFVVVAASFSKSSVFVCLHETGVTKNDIVFKFFHFGERFQIFPESPKTIPSFSSFPCKQEAKTEKYFCGFVDFGLV